MVQLRSSLIVAVPVFAHVTLLSAARTIMQEIIALLTQWAGSCWYYLRYIDPRNAGALVDKEAERYWMPVDLYVGGAEHAVLHLLYARFWHKVRLEAE